MGEKNLIYVCYAKNLSRKKYNIQNGDSKLGQVVDIKTDLSRRGVNQEKIRTHYVIQMILPEEFCTDLNPKIKELELYKVGLIVN